MPHNVNSDIWLVGAGAMAIEYAKVLRGLNVSFRTIGRGKASAVRFEQETGVRAETGGIEEKLRHTKNIPETAIVAVPVSNLFGTTELLIKFGVKRLLVEKPGVLCKSELQDLKSLCREYNVSIYFAFNRRFFPSVKRLKQELKENTPLLCSFEFTEWSHKIANLEKEPKELSRWMWANSSHVIDLVFYLIGPPIDNFVAFKAGSLPWHPSGSNFIGAGTSSSNCLFNYSAKWNSAGRWKLSVATHHGEYSLEPLESLNFQEKGQLITLPIDIETIDKSSYKDGLFELVESFLQHKNLDVLVSLKELEKLQKIVWKIAGYED